MEIIELENHPFFVGCQYHPEYLTRPLKPAPLFNVLILAVMRKLMYDNMSNMK
jgi:CTP synthase